MHSVESHATHLESVNLSSLFFIAMGGPKAHVKLATSITRDSLGDSNRPKFACKLLKLMKRKLVPKQPRKH
jgi:hypothetical protein